MELNSLKLNVMGKKNISRNKIEFACVKHKNLAFISPDHSSESLVYSLFFMVLKHGVNLISNK
jgi:hypothetical protein